MKGEDEMNRIITISREFGSGGREIGRRLAEKMGIAYYDQEIIRELMNRTEFAEEYIRHMDEKAPISLLPITTARTFGAPANYALEQNLKLYKQESQVIRDFAEKSDCIIVGRCADYVLHDMKPVRLFIFADMESKMARCRRKGKDAEGLTDKELRQKIVSVDKRRARYYKFFADQIWGDKGNCELCINTSSFVEIKDIIPGLESMISSYIRQMKNN